MMSDFDLLLQDQNPWWTDPARRRALRWPEPRSLQPQLLRRLESSSRRATILLGARQVGKTVLLLQTADALLDAELPPVNLTYFDFSDDRLADEITCRAVAECRPVGFREDVPRVLLFDEIGRAPDWDRWLKGAVDREEARIAATDSAASLLKTGGRESGLGRWDELRIDGLSLTEAFRLFGRMDPEVDREDLVRFVLSDPRLVELYLSLGGFPEHLGEDLAAIDPPLVRSRLRSDIADRAIVRDLLHFGVDVERVRALFLYLVQDSGAIFEAADRARSLEADPRSVADWLRLLEEACLVCQLPRFAQRASRRLQGSGRPKFFAADHGLVAAFSPGGPGEPAVRGSLFEAVVYRHLRELARKVEGTLSYFRVRTREVDFVLEVGERKVGVEVTSSREVRPDKLEKLLAANEILRADRLFLVYGGVSEREVEGVRAVPLARFLATPEMVLPEEVAG